MKRLLCCLISVLGLLSSCSKPHILSAGEFTREFAAAIQKAAPGAKITIVRDLELKVTSASGHESTSFLDNAYGSYRQDPKAQSEVIQRYVLAGIETITESKEIVDRTHIVPVIKDRPWLAEIRQALISRGAKDATEYVFDEFGPDLVVLYAEDSPKNIRYLTPKDLKSAQVQKESLRALACENLRRLLPKIERHGANGVYMVTAGGDYEASLLLLESIWSTGQFEVRGDVVVAIPSRDLLLVTGSEDRQGLQKVSQLAKKASSEGPYRLTPKLFVRRDGKFEEFR